MQIADLFFSIKAEGADKVGQQLNALGDSLVGIGSSMMENVSKPILNFFMDSIELSSDVVESMNVVSQVFGKMGDEVGVWSRNLIEDFGLTEKQAMQYVGSMGAMMKSSGLSATASREMAQSLVELTGDMSSFYNLSHDEMWEKLRAGISGETEPLKALGINMSVANMEAYALAQGIKKSWKEMNQAEQTSLRYAYIMDVTKDAQGDFARTSDGFANKMRTIEGRFDTLSKKLGDILLPFVEKAINLFDGWLVKFMDFLPQIDKGIIVIGLLATTIAPLIMVVGVLVGGLAGLVGIATGLFALISTVGLPVFLGITAVIIGLSGWVLILTPIVISFGVAIIGLVTKTGLLKDVFLFLQNLFYSVSAVMSGDLMSAFIILTEKMGLSKKQAYDFINSLTHLKDTILKVKDVVLATGKVIGAMFTGDRQKMIDTLIKKFGLSKEEAEKFANRIVELRDKAIDLYNNLKVKVINVLIKVIDTLKKLGMMIYDNRDKIIKFIAIMVEFGVMVYKVISGVKNAFNDMQTAIKVAFAIARDNVTKFVSAIKTIVSIVDRVKSKIKGIIFPSPPSWLSKIPGFANGVRNFAGGWAMVGEQGAELVHLPTGADVYSHDESREMMNRSPNITTVSGGSTSKNYSIGKVVIDARTIKEMNDISDFFKKVETEIQTVGFSY